MEMRDGDAGQEMRDRRNNPLNFPPALGVVSSVPHLPSRIYRPASTRPASTRPASTPHSDRNTHFRPEMIDFRLYRSNFAGAFGAQQNSENASDRKAGLRGKLASFLFVDEHNIRFEVRG
jgi:hypothetical protein